ncbi:MAG: class I SAM-dependent methyltransferase [Anaerolineales bacterium]
MPRYTDYNTFAWVYNQHWGGFAPLVLPTLKELVLDQLPEGARILDVCCGTGQLAQLLTGQGFQVTGVDGSEEMLHFARQNASAAAFILADARDFDAGTGFDAALSTFDSLNHVMSIEDLTGVFRNVRAALADGGVFVFDLNMDNSFQDRWQGSFGIVEDAYVVVMRNKYNARRMTGYAFVTMLFQDESNPTSWTRTDLTLTQRNYSEEEVRAALMTAGFAGVETSCPMETGRTFFRCV